MKNVKYFKLLLLTVLLILCSIAIQPNETYAGDTYTVVPGSTATLVSGSDFNIKIKRLVTPSAYYYNTDNIITSIEWTNVAPTDGVTVVTVSGSGSDVIAYLDGTIIKLYTTAETVYLNEDSSNMFYSFTVLETLPMIESRINTSNVINFTQMFNYCKKLTTLDLSSWQVTNKCKNLEYMFRGCENLETLTCNFNTWDVSNVTGINYMFSDCKKLTSINLSTWNVSNCTAFDHMFYNCYKLSTLDLSNLQVTNKCTCLTFMFSNCNNLESLICDFTSWNTSNVTDFSVMFQYCKKLTSINLSTWDVSNGTTFSMIFGGCENLTTMDLSSWQVTNKCTNLSNMFYWCKNLETLTCDFTKWNVSNVTTFRDMFNGCKKLTEIDLSNWQVTNKCTGLSDMFEGCKNLEKLTCDFTKWNVSNVTNFSYMFDECSKLTTLDLSNWQVTDKCTMLNHMFGNCENLTTLTCDFMLWNTSNVTYFTYMFIGCIKLTSLNLSTWDVSNGTSFESMFCGCEKLTLLNLMNWQVTNKCTTLTNMFQDCNNLDILTCDFTTWDVSNVTSFSWMFKNCYKLTTLDLSNWQVTNKCTKLNTMFYSCSSLTTLNLSTWDVSNVTDFSWMFCYCKKLTELNLSSWNVTNKCNNLENIFYDCENLETLTCDFTTWDVSNVTSFSCMFKWCEKLTSLDLTGWQVTNKCTNLSSTFLGCNNLETLICDFNTWDVSNVTTFINMFYNCKKLTTLNISNWQVTNKCTTLSNMFIYCDNLEKIKMFNTYNISSEDMLKNLFSNDMVLDNDEDGIGDDSVLRKDAIKDTNSTDKQIYIKYIAPTYSVLTTGKNFNAKIKSLVTPSATYNTFDKTITSIEWTNVAPADGITTVKVSESGADVIAYLNGTSVKLYTIVDTVYLNEDSSCMFIYFNVLESLPMVESKLNTSNVTNFISMFENCKKLTTLDLTNWQVTNKCIYLHQMFEDCQNLETLNCDFTTWNISNVTNFQFMFSGCEKLTTLDLTNWQVTNKCTCLYAMFSSCKNLVLTCNFTTWDVSNVDDFRWMFGNCEKLTALDLSNWQISNKCTDLSYVFYHCKNLETLNLSTWNVSNINSFQGIFGGCEKLTTLDLTSWRVTDKCTNLDSMFQNCKNLKTLICDFNTWDTSNVATFSIMFSGCENLLSLNLSTWNVSNSTSFNAMFNDCQKLISLDLSGWLISNKCTSLGGMFFDCKNLDTLTCDFTTWDTSNVANFSYMFCGCKKLTELNLSNLRVTNKCTNLSGMFDSCENLESLNLSTWDVSNVINFSYMFFRCTKLTSLDLSGWQVTTKCTSLNGIFDYCENLEKIKIFNTYNISSEDMLKNLFSIDMMLDNNEDGVGDDTVARRNAIKDVNTTDKQIYIKYVHQFTIYIHSNNLVNLNNEPIGDSKIITINASVGNDTENINKILNVIQELKDDGYVTNDSVLISEALKVDTAENSLSIDGQYYKLRNGNENSANTRKNVFLTDDEIKYVALYSFNNSINSINLCEEVNEEYHFYVINPIYNIRVNPGNINIGENFKIGSDCGYRVYYGNKLVYSYPYDYELLTW